MNFKSIVWFIKACGLLISWCYAALVIFFYVLSILHKCFPVERGGVITEKNMSIVNLPGRIFLTVSTSPLVTALWRSSLV